MFKPSTAFAVGDLVVNWGVPEGSPIFTVSGAFPGQSESRNVTVSNSAAMSRPVAVRGVLDNQTASMSGVLKITISEGGTALYGPRTLQEFFDDSNSSNGIALSNLSSGATTTYEFKLVFVPEAGNEFQNKEIKFDLNLGVGFTLPAECGELSQYNAPIFGTSGNDKLFGGNKKDLIIGLEGDDIIQGGNNDDCIVGGDGNNKIDGGNGRDVITSGSGDDRIDGGNNDDQIIAGNGKNIVQGGNGNDQITTGTGVDLVDGGNGRDRVYAGEGDDNLKGVNGNDILYGEGGFDKANGGNGADICEAEVKINCEI